jgi:hypothetical protein
MIKDQDMSVGQVCQDQDLGETGSPPGSAVRADFATRIVSFIANIKAP